MAEAGLTTNVIARISSRDRGCARMDLVKKMERELIAAANPELYE